MQSKSTLLWLYLQAMLPIPLLVVNIVFLIGFVFLKFPVSSHTIIIWRFPLCVFWFYFSFFKYHVHNHGWLHISHLWFYCNSLLSFQTVLHKRHWESQDRYLWPYKNGLKETVEEWGGICEHLKLSFAVDDEQASLNMITDGCCESLHRGSTVLAIINHYDEIWSVLQETSMVLHCLVPHKKQLFSSVSSTKKCGLKHSHWCCWVYFLIKILNLLISISRCTL